MAEVLDMPRKPKEKQADHGLIHRAKDQAKVARMSRAIKALRAECGLTQARAAERIGIPMRTLINYEVGHRVPSGIALYDLVTGLGFDMSRWQEEYDRELCEA